LKVNIIRSNIFYLFVLILTVANNLVSIIAAKFIAVDLSLSKTLFIWLVVMFLSFIYPILSINYFVALVAGKIFFDEPITAFKIAGSVILVIGVFLILLSSQKTEVIA